MCLADGSFVGGFKESVINNSDISTLYMLTRRVYENKYL